ncbi:MAG: putative O-glycosylation ligase, exosortase A system-associated [Sedimenticola sp.]
MRDILLLLIVFSSIPFILKRPYIGILMFAWISYMNPHRLTWGIAYDFPFAALILAVTAIGLLITKDMKKLPSGYFVIYVWIAWAVWMNFTTPFALEPEVAASEWERAVKIQLVSFLTIMLLQSKERLMIFIWVVALSVGFYGIKGGVFTILTQGNYLVWGPEGTFFSGNNGLAIALLMVLPLIRFLQVESDNKWIKLFLIGSMILCALSVIASYSRGAFLAAAAVAFYLLLKSRHKIVIAPVLILSAVSMLWFMPEKYFDRLETIETFEEDRSAMGRINAWYFAFNVAEDNPITGGGFGVFRPGTFLRYAPDPLDYHDAHSIYFEVLGEHGFIGLALFLLLGISTLLLARSTAKITKKIEDLHWAYNLVNMLHVGVIAYAVGGLFLGLAYFDLYYHLIALVILTRLLVDQHLAESGINDTRATASREAPRSTYD